jgi:hypothetical protein
MYRRHISTFSYSIHHQYIQSCLLPLKLELYTTFWLHVYVTYGVSVSCVTRGFSSHCKIYTHIVKTQRWIGKDNKQWPISYILQGIYITERKTNIDPWIYHRLDQAHKRNKHPSADRSHPLWSLYFEFNIILQTRIHINKIRQHAHCIYINLLHTSWTLCILSRKPSNPQSESVRQV